MNSHSLLFKQLFDQQSGTFTYLLADPVSRDAVLIDGVYEQFDRDMALLRELDVRLLACIETHCHADHVTGAWLMQNSTGAAILAGAGSGIAVTGALRDADVVPFGQRSLTVLETPGHTNGCISLVLDDRSMVFTGDCLLIRGCGRTDFQEGSSSRLYRSIKGKLFALPDDCLVYPGHDYSGRTASTVGEERRLNPRIGGEANETDFVGYMDNLQLPHPKKLDIAVPANLKAGRPTDDRMPKPLGWSNAVRTYGGVLEVSSQWVAAHRDEVHLLDVRTRHETEEERARIDGAQLIPIDELRARLSEVPRDKPVMTICRSGKRSVLAFTILRDAGYERVASVKGGLLQWQAEGLATHSA